MSEFDYIRWLALQQRPHARVKIPIGDDTALIETQTQTLVAADMLLDGVHFDLRHLPRCGRTQGACRESQ